MRLLTSSYFCSPRKGNSSNEKFDSNIIKSCLARLFARCEVPLADVGIVASPCSNAGWGFLFPLTVIRVKCEQEIEPTRRVRLVIQLSKPAWRAFGRAMATGSGDTDSPTALKALKENIQPLTFSTVVVFFLLSTVFPELTGIPTFKGVGGFLFPFLFLLPFLFPSSVHTLGTSFGAE